VTNTRRKGFRNLYYGWWVALAYFILNIYFGGALQQGFTVFFNPIRTSLGVSATVVTLAIQFRSMISVVTSPAVGLLFDRVGPRPLMLGSCFVGAAGMLLLSFASSASVLFVALFITALGTSVWMAGTGPATMANWFVRKRGTAIGLILAGISLGGVLIPGMVWVEQTWGWHVLARVLAAGLLIIGVPMSLVLRHRPEQYGLLPDGALPAAETASSATLGRKPAGSGVRAADFTFGEALRSRALWALVLAQAMTSIGGQAAMLFFIPHLEADAGISPALAGVALTAIGLLGVIGQPLVGWLSDISRKRLVLGVANASAAVSVVLFAVISQPWHLIPFVLLYGLTARTGFPVLASILAEYFGRANYGKIQGVVLGATSLFGTASALLVAAAFDATESYVLPFLVLGFLEFLSLGFLAAATRPKTRIPVATA